jgi:hypothetical protein
LSKKLKPYDNISKTTKKDSFKQNKKRKNKSQKSARKKTEHIKLAMLMYWLVFYC